jgi:hypothetical protein
MQRYWIDSSVFINSSKTTFAFDINKSFWNWLDGALKKETVMAPAKVYKEIVDNTRPKDQLAVWVKSRRKNGLCVEPSGDVFAATKQIADYVFNSGRYQQPFALEFSRCADPWLIAHAMADKGIIVTQETERHSEAQKVRIPDVAGKFDVDCMKVWDMLRALKVTL